MINSLEKKQIVQEITEALEGMNWDKGLFQIFFDSVDSFGSGLGYFDNENKLQIPYFTDEKGRQNVRELKNHREICQYFVNYYLDCKNKKTRWNRCFFTVSQDGEGSIECIWDDEYHIQNQKDLAKASATILYERFYEILSFEILPDTNWDKAEVKSFISNNSVVSKVAVSDKIIDLKLPEKWEKYFIDFHTKTNGEDAHNFWNQWNTMTIQMQYIDRFDFEKDVIFTNE